MIYLLSVGLAGMIFAATLFTYVKGDRLVVTKGSIGLLIVGFMVLLQSAYTGPMYNVWQKQLTGKAELAQAEWNRQIIIEEAKAKQESAKSWAQAEIERAKGSDEANRIMKQSLGNNENYLRWLWIEKMDKLNGQIVYLPSDGGMPILEAGKTVK